MYSPADTLPMSKSCDLLGQLSDPMAVTAHSLGVVPDKDLSFQPHTANLTRSCSLFKTSPFLSIWQFSLLHLCINLPLQLTQNAAYSTWSALPHCYSTFPSCTACGACLQSQNWLSPTYLQRFITLSSSQTLFNSRLDPSFLMVQGTSPVESLTIFKQPTFTPYRCWYS